MHGEDGLAGIVLPDSARVPEPDGAVAMLRRLILEHPEPVTIVALAPQTNLALLLRIHPEVADNIERIVFMGGSAGIGNATAVAEFNVWHDPEAAAAVIDSGVPCYMYGLDVFMQVAIDETLRAAAWPVRANPAVALAGQLLSHRISFSADEEAVYSGSDRRRRCGVRAHRSGRAAGRDACRCGSSSRATDAGRRSSTAARAAARILCTALGGHLDSRSMWLSRSTPIASQGCSCGRSAPSRPRPPRAPRRRDRRGHDDRLDVPTTAQDDGCQSRDRRGSQRQRRHHDECGVVRRLGREARRIRGSRSRSRP